MLNKIISRCQVIAGVLDLYGAVLPSPMFLSCPPCRAVQHISSPRFPRNEPPSKAGVFFALHCLLQRCKGVVDGMGLVLPPLSCLWDSRLGRWKSQILITEYSQLEGTDQQGSSS